MKLMADQVTFCTALGITFGFDIDDDQPQLTHLCWPWGACLGALCKTDRLWGSGGGFRDEEGITCNRCPQLLIDLMAKDAQLLSIIGTLSARCSSLQNVVNHADEFLWAKENPEKAALMFEGSDLALNLRKAIEEDHEDWVLRVRQQKETP